MVDAGLISATFSPLSKLTLHACRKSTQIRIGMKLGQKWNRSAKDNSIKTASSWHHLTCQLLTATNQEEPLSCHATALHTESTLIVATGWADGQPSASKRPHPEEYVSYRHTRFARTLAQEPLQRRPSKWPK